ncbi:LytR/AlgR family response regulator transcription factor [Streptococcus ovis]|uniref:LytR/AlgR family response regulator transcription factor n=1 Tax=Streptococcus ovis TaxID=82806 RepID=UPI00036EA95D|nr:LytTR family DNA-binding domain-containing protein [Streptococcus ovis]
MTYRIALVDDQVDITEELAGFCQRFAQEEDLEVSVLQFNSAEVFLDYFHEFQGTDRSFDLIVLDIEMGAINGMEAAQHIRKEDEMVSLIFVTSLAQYAIQGYAVDALDFVIKPVDYDSFSFRLERALRAFKKQVQKTVQLPFNKTNLSLNIEDILYIEVSGHQLSYHTVTETYVTSGSLSTIEQRLPSHLFAKPSQSFLVNLAHVEAIQGNDLLLADHTIPISRLKKASFLQAFSNYIGGFK